MNKRGLSAVIATLVIILLALVSTGIVWVVVKGIISGGAEGISLGGFTKDLVIKSVQVGENNVSIDIKRDSTEGNLIRIKFVFENGTNSEIIEKEVSIEILEQKTIIFNNYELSLTNITKISVAPIYLSESGEEIEKDVTDSFRLKGDNIITGGVIGHPADSNFANYGPVGLGTADYSLSGGGDDPIRFTRVIIDPLDVQLGETQTFTAYVSSDYELVEVTTETQLDNELMILPLELQLDGSWSASWQVYDTHSNTYRTTFIAIDSQSNEKETSLTWTDPCSGITHGEDWVMPSDCTVSTVDGLDVGDITVGTGVTLTINEGGTFVWTNGNSITMSGGQIAIDGTLQKGYLYYYDDDGDDYSPNATYIWTSTASWAGAERAGSITDTDDCDDLSQYVWKDFSGMTADLDHDGYNASTVATECVGSGPATINGRDYWDDTTNSSGWLDSSQKLGNDCYDSNESAYTGQTAYFTAHRGDNSFDYNCDSAETKQYNTANQDCEGTCEAGEGECTASGINAPLGWDDAAPACGVADTYFIGNEGTCTYQEPDSCVSPNPTCDSESRTQRCR